MIATLPYLPFVILLWQVAVPYKPSNEYEIIIDYKLEDRPPADRYKAEYDVSAAERKKSSGPLPYLKLEIKPLKLGSDELKVKVVNSNGNLVFNRKVTLETVIKLDVGFIDDVKDRVSPHEFTVFFFSDSKTMISKIHLMVMEDGTFLVNNETKGKF